MKVNLLVALLFLVFICVSARRVAQVVPNGSNIVVGGDHLVIQRPDGSSSINHLTPRTAKRDDNGWIASISSTNNYTYYSAEWNVPPIPSQTVPYTQILYYKNSLIDVANTAIIEVVLEYYDMDDQTTGWSLASWYVPWNGDFIQSTPINVKPGDKIRGELQLIGNSWTLNGYVNGTKVTQLQVQYTSNVFIEFPSKPNFVVATTSDTAAQGFLTVLPYNATKTSGRLFTFTSDGYIRLSANPNLVLDVNGAVASEGARVLVFPKKTPVTQNQQWVVYGRLIYSRLSNSTYSLTVNNASQVVLTKANPQAPYINYNGPAGVGITGSAQFALEVYNIYSCSLYPPSNRLDARNFILKKGTQQVTPAWSTSITASPCNVNIFSNSTVATISWNSTAVTNN